MAWISIPELCRCDRASRMCGNVSPLVVPEVAGGERTKTCQEIYEKMGTWNASFNKMLHIPQLGTHYGTPRPTMVYNCKSSILALPFNYVIKYDNSELQKPVSIMMHSRYNL